MISKCGICTKYKFNIKDEVHYTALNSKGLPESYVMKICEDCANEIETQENERKRSNRGKED